ncbi:MAG: PAS domain S-box protein [Phycisphaerae bacterium]|jgi:PAS domain S-box-containing protein
MKARVRGLQADAAPKLLMPESRIQVLLVEDSAGDARLLRELLWEVSATGFEIHHVLSLQEALDYLNAGKPCDVVMLDLSLPDSHGVETISRLYTSCPRVPVVVLTGTEDEEIGIAGLRAGAQDYLVKGQADNRLIRRTIHHAIHRNEMELERERLLGALREAKEELELRVQERTADLTKTVWTLESEITARIQAESALRESEERYRLLFESSPVGIGISDFDGQILAANRCLCEMVGTTAEKIKTMPVRQFWADTREWRHLAALIRRSGKVSNHEAVFLRIDGLPFLGLVDAQTIRLGDKEVLFTTVRDVTRIKQAEKTLRDTNELLERMFDSIHLHVAYMDAKFNYIRVNRAYAASHGQEPEYFVGKNHFALFPNKRNQAVFREVIRIGQPCFFYEKPADVPASPGGALTYWDWSLQPVKDATGKVAGVIMSLLNVTERISAREQLDAERRRLFSVLHELPGFVSLHAVDYSIRFANQKFVELFGYPQGRKCHEMLHGRQSPCEDCRTASILAKDSPAEWEWTSKTGRTYHVWGYPFQDIDGAQLVMQLGMDVTDRKLLQKQLLEISDSERRRMGLDLHDVLGQDLTGIAFLSKGLSRKLQAKAVAEAHDAEEISRYVNDAIGKTRSIARGLCPVSLTDGLVGGLQEFASTTEDVFGISCRLEVKGGATVPDGPSAVHVFSIVREAVNNAIRHGKARNIEITLCDQGDHMSLTIRDDGKGLPKEFDSARGIGLHTMQYRAETIGASLQIGPADGRGVLVSCWIPKGATDK